MKPDFHANIVYNPLQLETAKYIDKNCNVVILAPTSSGKTCAAEQFLFTAISKGLKGIYLSPLKALTEEKKTQWEPLYPLDVVTSDYQKACTFSSPLILMTTESLDSKTRGNPSWLQKVGCLAVDEAHLLASDNRGDALEVGLIRFTQINRNARIVLLSATIPNANDLASWLTRLNGKEPVVVETSWRPVKQEHHLVKVGNKPWDVTKATISLVTKLEKEHPDLQMLIFVHTVGRGTSFAQQLGCPFHYSKVTKEKKKAMEDAFSEKKIKKMVCTSTLAYGVNLPADIAVISGGTRGPSIVDPIDIKQEAGRAGRYGLSEKGFAYYVFEDYLADELYDKCLQTPDVHSVLDRKFYFHIVSFIHREGMQRKEIEEFAKLSFDATIDVGKHLDDLRSAGIIEGTDLLRTTKFGKAAALMYLDPFDLVSLHDNLLSQPTTAEGIAKAFACIPSNEVQCYIPDDIKEHIVECGFGQQTIHATCLERWLSGDDLGGTFGMLTPIIVNDVNRWLAALSIINLPKNYLSSIGLMLSNGVPEYLISLVSQHGVGRKKAMKLYEHGIKDLKMLLANPVKGTALLGKALYNRIEMANNLTGKITLNF